ncbi:ASCH domain-containing protein [[Ruminococcus] lactaris]|uniref:ASCH domain-containing protein n=1 Tax=[Ruminococcus] lactaris TaxID=46228 RepID=UPI0026DD0001|nr:ASCH domain-containing protein [[Ruminococcus] lactaris]
MDGLIIKKKWLDLIASGEKTLEIRGCNTKKIGKTIYLLESGSNLVRATCTIDSTYPISCSDWCEEKEKHCVEMPYSELLKRYKIPYAWVLRSVSLMEEEWKYKHPKGAIVWVKDVMPSSEITKGYIDVSVKQNM